MEKSMRIGQWAKKAAGFLLAALLAAPAIADDTELFTQPPGTPQPPPNVMMLLDNSANWSRNAQHWPDGAGGEQPQGISEVHAIKTVVSGLTKKVTLGVAMNAGAGSTRGGYIRFGARDMTVAANKTALMTMMDHIAANINSPQEKVSDIEGAAAFFELYRYFSGLNNFYNGSSLDAKSDYAGNPTAGTTVANGITSGFAYPSSSGGAYVTPLTATNACARNYIIYIANNAQAGSWNNGAQVYDGVSAGLKVSLPDTTAADDWSDEWARFLNLNGAVSPSGVNGKVITYVIDVYNAQQNPTYTALLKSVAQQGGGRYFQASNEAAIVNAINTIFDEIQAVNSIFAAVSLPVSVNVRGTNLNQVYLGVFRPDANAAPNWPGNLKQYKLGVSADGGLMMVDKNGADALASSGYFQAGAVSYWSAANSYWTFDPDSSVDNPISDSPDGPLVERGGAAQMARWDVISDARRLAADRKILTHIGGSPGSPVALTDGSGNPLAAKSFDGSNAAITQGSLLAASAAERAEIIDWVRGADLNLSWMNPLDGTSSAAGIRPFSHGDVVHSRPAVINYNRFGDDDDVGIFYGANDGLLRAIQGGQQTAPTDPGGVVSRPVGGGEYWAFAAEEFFDSFKRMRDDAPVINWSGSTGSSVTLTGKLSAGAARLSIDPGVVGVSAGMGVSGTGVPAGSSVLTVATIPSLRLSAPATASADGVALQVELGTETVGTVFGSTTLSSASIPAWMSAFPAASLPEIVVDGPGIAAGTRVVSAASTGGHIMSLPATGTQASVSLSLEKDIMGFAISGGIHPSSRAYFPNGYAPVQAGTTPAFSYRTAAGPYAVGSTVDAAGSVAAWEFGTAPAATAPSVALTARSGAPIGGVKKKNNMAAGLTIPAGSAAASAVVMVRSGGANVLLKKGQIFANSAGTPFCGGNVYINADITVTAANTSVILYNGGSAACTIPGASLANNTKYTVIDKVSVLADLLRNETRAPIKQDPCGTPACASTVATAGDGWSVSGGFTATLAAGGGAASMPYLDLSAGASSSTNATGGEAMRFGFDTTGDLANGTTTIANIPPAAGTLIATGMSVASPSGFVQGGTTITGSILPGIQISQAATATNPAAVVRLYLPITGNLTLGSDVVGLPAVDSGLAILASAGDAVLGANVPVGATFVSRSPMTTFVTMDSLATASGDQSLTFTSATGASGGPKPYFFDGPIGIWRQDIGSDAGPAIPDGKIIAAHGDKAWIYAPMRRGGRMIYAFNVTDPANPKLMWKKGCTDAGACDAGYEDLGQTWSMPQPTQMRLDNGSGTIQFRPVLVFGGGYDAAYEDLDPVPVGATRSMARGVWFVDAETGEPIRVFRGSAVAPAAGVSSITGKSWGMTADQATAAAGMTCSMPADVALLTRDPVTGYTVPAFRAYAADTCGQIWRLDTADPDPDKWIVTRFASVGISQAETDLAGYAGADKQDLLDQARRKFLFAPDVVYGGSDANGPFHYVLIGSGDREHPFQGYGDALHPLAKSVTNRFYMFKDYNDETSYAAGVNALIPPPAVSFDTDGDGTAESLFAGGAPLTQAALYDATADLVRLGTAAEMATAREAMISGAAGNVYQGWYITLEAGEKVVGGATSSAGYVYFGTNKPKTVSAACSTNLGEARLYQVGIKDAGAAPPDPYTHPPSAAERYQVIPGGGLPPTPVPVSVVIDGEFKEGVLSGTTVKQPDDTAMGSRIRVYSRKVIDKKTFE